MTVPTPAPAPSPPLPPETQLGFWVPVVHYLLATALVVAVAFHVDLHLSPSVQAIAVLAAAILVVVGTGMYVIHHYGMNKLALAAFTHYLESVIPGIVTDVEALKTTQAPPTVATVVYTSGASSDAVARAQYQANHPVTVNGPVRVEEATAEVADAAEKLAEAAKPQP